MDTQETPQSSERAEQGSQKVEEPPLKFNDAGKSLLRRAVWIAALGGFLFGYDTGVISGALLFLQKEFGLSALEQGMVVSGLLLGAALGAIYAGRAADRFGRRRTLTAVAIIFLIGIAIVSLTPNTAILIAGRFVLGLAVGAGSASVPVFIGEIAPPERRGRLVSLNQLMITIGIVSAYVIDLIFSGSGSWRAMFAIGAIPALALLFGMSLVPETPRWLVATGREDRARDVLEGITERESADAYIRHLSEDTAALKRPQWRHLLRPYVRPALVVGATMAAIQQFVGINTIIYYAPKIMQQTGLSASNAILNSVIIGALNVVMTIVSIRLVDRWGRKPLLYTSLIGMTVSLVGLWAAFEVSGLKSAQSTLALIFILVYIASFAIGLGPIFWLLIAEVFPNDVRGEGAGASTTVNWLSNFAVSLTFPLLIAAIGEGWTFAIYAGVSVLAIAFVARFVPETKDRSFEEIDARLRRHGPTAPSQPERPERPERPGRPAHA